MPESNAIECFSPFNLGDTMNNKILRNVLMKVEVKILDGWIPNKKKYHQIERLNKLNDKINPDYGFPFLIGGILYKGDK